MSVMPSRYNTKGGSRHERAQANQRNQRTNLRERQHKRWHFYYHDEYAKAVNHLTNAERKAWARAGYPGNASRNHLMVYAFERGRRVSI